MSPVDQNLYSPLPSFEGKLQDQPNSSTFYPTYETVSSVSCPNSSQPSLAEAHDHDDNKAEREHFLLYDVSNYGLLQSPASQSTTDGEDSGNTDTKKFVSNNSKNGSTKWMSSKMRMMRKLRNPDGVITTKMGSNMGTPKHPVESSCSSNDTTPRVCSDCNTTKTPLWRSGPQGPKSLCNACGIRQRKARKATAAAMNGGLTPNNVSTIKAISKEKESDGGKCAVVPIKTRSKFFSSQAQEKLQRDDFDMGLNRSSDEKEAAILLMALSSDMIFG